MGKVAAAGCTAHLHQLLAAISQTLSQVDFDSLLAQTESISGFFCATGFVLALDSVVQDVMSQLRWNLQGKIATEVFLTLARLIALCRLRNWHCNLTISVRIIETVSYFTHCFAPETVKLAVLQNLQTVKLAVNPTDEKALDSMLDIADTRYSAGEFHSLCFANVSMALAHYYRGKQVEEESELRSSMVYFQRALNCAARAGDIHCCPKGLNVADFCRLFLSDLAPLSLSVCTRPYHSWRLGGNYALRSELIVEERSYEVTAAGVVDASEETLCCFFRSVAGAQQPLFLVDFSFLAARMSSVEDNI